MSSSMKNVSFTYVSKCTESILLVLKVLIALSGGEDFDQRVMEYFLKLYKKKKGKDVRKDNRAVQKLRREVEKAKRALSSQHTARVDIESFYEGDDFSETLTRAKFEELNMVSLKIFGECDLIRCSTTNGSPLIV